MSDKENSKEYERGVRDAKLAVFKRLKVTYDRIGLYLGESDLNDVYRSELHSRMSALGHFMGDVAAQLLGIEEGKKDE